MDPSSTAGSRSTRPVGWAPREPPPLYFIASPPRATRTDRSHRERESLASHSPARVVAPPPPRARRSRLRRSAHADRRTPGGEGAKKGGRSSRGGGGSLFPTKRLP
nr:unnamed protein product [Digitaria exilis]